MVNLSKLIAHGETLIRGKERQGSLRATLMWNAGGTFALKVASTALLFLLSLLLARLLGATGYGAYINAMAWISLLSVLSIMGLDKLLVREIAIHNTRSAWDLMLGLLRWTNLVGLLVSLGFALLTGIIIWMLRGHLELQMRSTLWIALIMLPLLVLMRLRQAAMRGLQHVVVGQLPEMLIMPIVFVVLVGGIYLIFRDTLSASAAIEAQVVAAGIAFLIGARQLKISLPQFAKEAPPTYQGWMWMRSVLPLLFIDSMTIISAQTDIIMVGAMKGAETVGIYAVAKKGAGLITFALLAVNMALAPTIASLYAAGDMEKLQRVVTKSARAILLGSLPIALGLIVFGHWFLLLFFGQDFTQGEGALAILSAGQLINAATGSVGLLLIMTGYERYAAMGIGICAVLNIVLNATLIPKWGLTGAAVATASSMIVWNVLLAIWVYRKLGIHSTALGEIGLSRQA